MSKRIPFFLTVALTLFCPGPSGNVVAFALESLTLPADLPPLDKRGSWRETLEDLNVLGVPQTWTVLGPLNNETAKSFERKLEPELNDDWTKPLTDNLGRLFRVSQWSKSKDDDGCYVDLYDVFSNPPPSPVACALTIIDSTVEGPALLWFENAGRAIVYFNNKEILSVTSKLAKVDASVRALYPLPVDLQRGRNYLKIKILKEQHKQALKGWGFFVRIERDDLDWRKKLLVKLKELYPDEDAAQSGAQERLMLARRYEKAGQPELAASFYKEVRDKYAAFEDSCDDACDALKRLAAAKPAAASADAIREWTDAERRFKAALAAGQTVDADRAMRDFIARFPFSEQAGLALCNRGGLRLDYAFDESARPFYERALREFSSNETVRALGVKGVEFARFYMPEHAQLETNRLAEAALNAIHRQLRNGNAHDNASGLKSLAELVVVQSGALVHAGGAELYPRCASVNQMAREFLCTLSPEERELFREPLTRAAEMNYRHAMAGGDALELEDIARKFPGASASAKALNQAGNMYLDRGLFARAAQAFRALQHDFKGSGLIAEPLAAAKEIHALERLGQIQAARDAAQKMASDYGAAKMMFQGREIAVSDFTRDFLHKVGASTATQTESGRGDYETFAANARRLGAAMGPAPVPDRLEWTHPIKQSESATRARSAWSEDRNYFHYEPFPVVSGGRIFFATREDVRAVDIATGKDVWSKSWGNAGYVLTDKFSGFPQTLPVLKDGKLFVRGISGEKNSVIRCYDAATGNVDWDSEKIPALRNFVWSSEPLATYNLIIAAYFEPLDHDTVRCGAAALDARTGALVWKRPFGIGNSGLRIAEKYKESRFTQVNYRVTLQLGPPSAYEGTIYTSTGLGSLAALNAYTGDVFWIAEYPRLRAGNLSTGNSGIEGFMPRMLKVLARGPSSPVVGDNVVALAPRDATGIAGFDRRTGELRWAHELIDARFIAGVCDGKLIAADDTVTALDLDTGKIAWEYPGNTAAGGQAKRLAGQPGFSGGMLYLPYDDGLHLVDAKTGEFKSRQTWDPKTSGPIANIVVSGSHLIGVNNSVLASIHAK